MAIILYFENQSIFVVYTFNGSKINVECLLNSFFPKEEQFLSFTEEVQSCLALKSLH